MCKESWIDKINYPNFFSFLRVDSSSFCKWNFFLLLFPFSCYSMNKVDCEISADFDRSLFIFWVSEQSRYDDDGSGYKSTFENTTLEMKSLAHFWKELSNENGNKVSLGLDINSRHRSRRRQQIIFVFSSTFSWSAFDSFLYPKKRLASFLKWKFLWQSMILDQLERANK